MKPKVMESKPMEKTQRQRWMGMLARASLQSLEHHWQTLANKPEFYYIRAPEVGLAMVRGAAGGSGEAFNLGEMTMTRAVVQHVGGMAGFGYVKGRSKRHAQLAAMFDAMLQNPEYHAELMQHCIDPLHQHWSADRARKAAEVAATKVDFFTMVRGEA